ncbi:MAG: protein translocase subunit SecF [Desulfobacteraceae bacterium]|jgi:preprotein translocase subunit SecF
MEFIKPDTNINFIGQRKTAFFFSLFLILASILTLIVHKGPKYGVDFAGGTQFIVKYENSISTGDVRNKLLDSGLKSPVIQKFGENEENQFQIRLLDSEHIDSAFIKNFASFISLDKNNAEVLSVDMVGPQVSQELRSKALLAIFYSLLFITIYISGRFEMKWGESAVIAGSLMAAVYFLSLLSISIPYLILFALTASLIIFWYRDLRFAMGAICALIHDVIITVGLFSLLDIEFNLPIIAALLTIIGYSLNDTIIVFDRIRENLKSERERLGLAQLINKSINETLSRTILTSGTTLLVLISLFVLGGGIIHDFSLAMITGIVIGTYSSIFIASPILLAWKSK